SMSTLFHAGGVSGLTGERAVSWSSVIPARAISLIRCWFFSGHFRTMAVGSVLKPMVTALLISRSGTSRPEFAVSLAMPAHATFSWTVSFSHIAARKI